ncbi:GNAT family N-acetyltransferase [Nocardia sp. CA-128927]|uniref:GNAT family N-acetyltransferase n=1 Tax=Nocardia sp. CA-128927 TaxID=3239975 RepID=UPI003D980C75
MTPVTSIVVGELEGSEKLADAIALYREVFALRRGDPAPSARLLAALARNGGIALGAYSGGELAGFTYGFLGRDQGGAGQAASLYHYMELLVVRPDHRGTGVGRALMYHLREMALACGLRTIRWVYDPLRADNAYFYLDVLAARGRDFVPNFYGIENNGRDRGHPTDRIIVEWDASVPARRWPEPPPGLVFGDPVIDPQADIETMLLAIPADSDYLRLDSSHGLRRRIRAELRALVIAGFEPVSCRRAADGVAVYRLVANTARLVRDVPPQVDRAPPRWSTHSTVMSTPWSVESVPDGSVVGGGGTLISSGSELSGTLLVVAGR